MKRIIIGLFLVSVSVVGVGEASAQCKCARTYPTAFDELKDVEAVFIGEVISKHIVEKPVVRADRQNVYEMEIKFRVKKVWRKNLKELVTVRFLVYGCNIAFDNGTEYLVYAINDKGRLRTYCCCSRTKPLSKAAEDLKEFEKRGEEPKQVIITPVSKS